MKKLIPSCFLIFSVVNSVLALDPPNFSLHEFNGFQVQSVIDLTGYRVEYDPGLSDYGDLPTAISHALSGVKNSLILLPVPKTNSFDFGLTISMYRKLKADGEISPTNLIAWVTSKNPKDELAQKIPRGIRVGGLYIIQYLPQPGMSLSGTNQILLDAANQGIPVRRILFGGEEQDFRNLMKLIPEAASQLREGVQPIQVDLYSGPLSLNPNEPWLAEGAWDAALQATRVIQNHRSLLIPQISIRIFGFVKNHFEEDKDWLASNRRTAFFENAELSVGFAEGRRGPRTPFHKWREKVHAARAYSEEVALEEIVNVVWRKTGQNPWKGDYSGPFLPAIHSLQDGVAKVRPFLDRYETIRGSIEK